MMSALRFGASVSSKLKGRWGGPPIIEDAVWNRVKMTTRVSLWIAFAVLVLMIWSAPGYSVSNGANTQIAKLHELQAAFHRDGTVHDLVNGDSQDVIDQRIRDVQSLWTDDGSLTLAIDNTFDGYYAGKADPTDVINCGPPSGNPSDQGTLCTFFKYVAGSYQAKNKFVSLAPAYKTTFDIQGNTASFYFECHFFNVATDPSTGMPLWTAVSHLTLFGSAAKVGGNWLFDQATAGKAGVPIP